MRLFGIAASLGFVLSIQMAGFGADASGTLELLMNNFQNPTEHLSDGSCCDLFCIGQCDNIFHFALDKSSGNANDAQTYFYWVKVTGTFQDENNNYFKNDMHGVSNPIVWPFDTWPGSALFKVYIEDDDQPLSSNDRIDGIIQRLTLTPAKSKSSAVSTTIVMSGIRPKEKTTLSMDYKLYCDDNYYGTDCSVYCLAQDSRQLGHYTCHPDTGTKLCRPGWEDVSSNCLTLSDDCINNTCINGAKCVDGIHSYTCSCMAGYTGRSCEANINECLSSPCQNGGTCSDLDDGYTCACANGFVGPQCAQNVCSQGQNNCRNGGTCYDAGKCFCPQGFLGLFCEQSFCETVPCFNGGTCMENNTCICSPGFLGHRCDVNTCDLISSNCQNGGTCVNGTCNCLPPFYGQSCEKKGCDSSTCHNGGVCTKTNEGNGYKCNCPESFSGVNCETLVNPCSAAQQPLNASHSSSDVSIFEGEPGILLIVLIIFVIILLIVVIILACLLIAKRRREGTFTKKRAASTMSTTTMISSTSVDESVTESPRPENFYSHIFSCSASPYGDSLKKPWRKLEGNWESKEMSVVENDYDRLEGGYIEEKKEGDGEVENAVFADLPEQVVCEIKDIYGDPIHLSKKLADC